jgi:hypothetical protein
VVSLSSSGSVAGVVDDVLAEQAVEEWLAHDLGRPPIGVNVLKESRRKSAVLRLHGAGPDGAAVIAKRCPTEVARVECTVYEQVLPSLSVVTVRLHGASDRSDGFTWLFLEDAGDVQWSSKLAAHRRLAAEWLAAAHIGAAEIVDTVELPRRGSDYYVALLRAARVTLDAALANDAIDARGQELLRELVANCDSLEEGWAEVEAILGSLPRTLTLPGFGKKNVRVREEAGGAHVFPFDFENAGWGAPAGELADIDLYAYGQVVGPAWCVERTDIEVLAVLGAGLRALKSIPGEARSLASRWPDRSLRKIAYYAADLSGALDALEAKGRGLAGG